MVTNIEALKSSSIVSVIERYIPLRKNGTNFIACCPFHSEKSPSFVVSDVKGMYKCFGCGKGGDVISFIKEYEKIDFNEALQRLSELTNIALEYDKAQKVGKSPSEVLEKINELAKAELQKHREIVEYLASRGITQEICERYDIGLVPSKEILLANFSAGELVESNFANEYEKGKISIPMRERISIAIRNPQHKVVAFVARTHPHYNFNKNAPKYINSKESYFYKKAQILYLYSNAKATIQAQKAAFVVEGYIDSILLHENGYKHALATGGTAFNIQHLNLLTRLDCEVIFCFDNDKSGMAANFRAVKVCFEAGFYRVKVALLKNKDSKGRLCKDINEALMAMDRHADKSARDDKPQPSLRGSEATEAIHKNAKADSSVKNGSPRGASTARDDREWESKAESTREKLDFNYLNGFEFFIKWLYKNKDKTSAFNEIKGAIAACKNFYDKQAFLECACKLTGVPQEYFTQDRLPTKQANDDYSSFIASILHSEECAYIASELDLSFLPKELEKSVRIFLASQKVDSSMDRHADKSARDDRETSNAPNLNTAQDSRIFDEKVGLCSGEQGDKTRASINAASHKLPALSQKAESIFKEFIQTQPLESEAFYQHYCDLYLAHLHREQTKARAKKDLHLVLALSEKIAQVKQDIHAQKAF
ncbi:DNA primase [Helicobacter canis]|uniref:DNA primase n=1 Tax=Helicobacter canis TaxID=29419 RepID=A0A377J143_9HELI|nr:DNA primase [Helicobacter canis]STO96202.1 DNA primase [Helicobacter canis]STO96267.1 DNA primase [Helicobacter canis]